jgi:TldD protein
VALPNLTIVPAKARTSLDDIVGDTKRGLYVDDITGGSDQQLLSGQFRSSPSAREIRNGKLGGWIKDLAFQFVTPTFWKSMDALGGPDTAVITLADTGVMDPLQISLASVSAVPARFRAVNVLNTGRTA